MKNYDIDSAIFAILQVNEVQRIYSQEECEIQVKSEKSCSSALWEENGSGTRIFGNQGLHQDGTENKTQASPDEENQTNKKHFSKVSNKQRKEQQRLEKKKRQEERHRQKVVANRSNNADNNKSETDFDTQVTLVKTFAALNI